MTTDLLSTAEAAAVLGVTPARLRVLLKEGRISGAEHVGRAWIIPRSSLAQVTRLPAHRPRLRGAPEHAS